MKNIIKLSVILVVGFALLSFSIDSISTKKYKCLLQLKNYNGEGAYVTVSLIKPNGAYAETLYINGDDVEWYEDLPKWFGFHKTERKRFDAITGESIVGGQRKRLNLNIDSSLLDKGYKIRFESAVEDQKYHEIDVELEFSSDKLKKKVKGNGYIRYVMISE